MNKKGFTLIELLVVIAIIGILSSIAIVYLSDARNKANDAKVSSNVTTAATQVELDRANGTTPTAVTIGAVISKIGDHPCTGTYAVSYTTDFSEVAFAGTECGTNSAVVFCADSQGYRGVTTKVITVFGTASTPGSDITGRCQ